MPNWMKKSFQALIVSGLGNQSPVKSERPKNIPTAKEIFALLSSNINAEQEKERCLTILNSIKSILDLSSQHQTAIQKSLAEQFSNLTKKDELLTLIENYRIVSKTSPTIAVSDNSEPKKWLANILQSHPLLETTETDAKDDVHSSFKIKSLDVPKINYNYITSYLQYTPHRLKTLDQLNYFKAKTSLISTASLKKIKNLTVDLDTALVSDFPDHTPNPQKIINVLLKQDNLYDLSKELKKLLHLPRINALGVENCTYKFLMEMEAHLEKAIFAYTTPQDFISKNHRQITTLIDITINNMPERPVPQALAEFIASYPKAPDEHLATRNRTSLSSDEKIFLQRRIEALKHAYQQIKNVIKAFGLEADGYKMSDISEINWASKKSFTVDDVRIPYISKRTQDLMSFVLFDWQKDVFHANCETIDGAKLRQLLIHFQYSVQQFPEQLSLLQGILKDKLSKITFIYEQPYHPLSRGKKINNPFVSEAGNFSSKKLKEFIQNLYEGDASVTLELWSLCASSKEKPYFDAWNGQKQLLKKLKDGNISATNHMQAGQIYIFPIYTKMGKNVANGKENNLEHYNQIIAKIAPNDMVDITYINPIFDKNYNVSIPNSAFKIILSDMIHADTANPSEEIDFLKNQNSFFEKLADILKTKITPQTTTAEKQTDLQSSTHSIRRGIEVVTR